MSSLMIKVFTAFASLLLPGLGHLVQGKILIGVVWLLVWLLVFTNPIIAILAAVHCLLE
jgi:hypothetical protein